MEARHVFFPYCIQSLGGSECIVLNRKYKPLGVTSSEWVVYETHPSVTKMKITPAIAKKLSWNESEATDVIFLYADGCVPTISKTHMSAYLARLAVLMALKCSASE